MHKRGGQIHGRTHLVVHWLISGMQEPRKVQRDWGSLQRLCQIRTYDIQYIWYMGPRGDRRHTREEREREREITTGLTAHPDRTVGGCEKEKKLQLSSCYY